MKSIIRHFLKVFLVSTGIYLFFFLLVDAQYGFSSWKSILVSGFSFGLIFSLILITIQFLIQKAKGKKIDEMNFNVDQKASIESKLTQQEVYERLDSKIKGEKWKIRQSENKIEISTKTSWKSWGELISLTFHDDNTIQIKSEPKIQTTMVDYGKNQQNIERIRTLLQA